MPTERHALDRALAALNDKTLAEKGRRAKALSIITIYAHERVTK